MFDKAGFYASVRHGSGKLANVISLARRRSGLSQVAFARPLVSQFPDGRGYSCDQIVAVLKSHVNRGIAYSKRAASSRNAVIGHAVNRNWFEARVVLCRLLPASGPAAVARFVISLGINAINRVVQRWALAHVGKEGFITIPPLADGNSPSTVARPILVFGSVAPPAHPTPDFIGGAVLPIFRVAMSQVAIPMSHVTCIAAR